MKSYKGTDAAEQTGDCTDSIKILSEKAALSLALSGPALRELLSLGLLGRQSVKLKT